MVIGVLNVVLGCLGVAAFLIHVPAIGRLLGGTDPGADRTAAFIAQESPATPIVQSVYLWLGLVCSVVLIGLGVAVIALRPWARLASILFALVDLARRGSDLVYALLVIYPVLHALALQETAVARSMEAKRYAAGLETSFFIRLAVAALFLVYPLAMLLVMLQPETARAFQAAPVEAEAEAPE
jgi:hypothetical protein